MKSPNHKKSLIIKLMIGIILLSFGASHGITGFLANIGWYSFIGIDLAAWYMHPAYQSMCWLAIGIAVSILVPMWLDAKKKFGAARRSLEH